MRIGQKVEQIERHLQLRLVRRHECGFAGKNAAVTGQIDISPIVLHREAVFQNAVRDRNLLPCTIDLTEQPMIQVIKPVRAAEPPDRPDKIAPNCCTGID